MQAEVERYVALSKVQKEEANALKAKFDRTCLEHQEDLNEKEKDFQRAEENFQVQLKAKDAKLAEALRRHEEVNSKRQEEYEATVQELRSSIQKTEEEKENKFKQYVESKKELEARYELFT